MTRGKPAPAPASGTAPARAAATRRRRASSDVEDAILAATLDILDEVGFADLTVEAVAARSGAAKTAVYRRWPSKVPLVVDALTRSRPDWPIPDTGDLRTDLVSLWQILDVPGHRWVERILPLVASYVGPGDGDLASLLRERYFEPRLQAIRVIVHRAAARGEIRPDADPELAFDLLFGPLAYRYVRGLPPDSRTVNQVVDLALEGLRPRREQG
jgi:AcrR family transcriptional regulator